MSRHSGSEGLLSRAQPQGRTVNELHVSNRGPDRWEVRIRKSHAIDVAYGLPSDVVSIPGVAGAILPAIQSITRYPLLRGETGAPTDCVQPLYIPEISQRCWMVVASANRALERGCTAEDVRKLADNLVEVTDEEANQFFREPVPSTFASAATQHHAKLADALDRLISQYGPARGNWLRLAKAQRGAVS